MQERRPDPVDTVIVLAHGQASLYEFLKARQEGTGRTVVILDRRGAGAASPAAPDTPSERRARTPEAALALMSVLGFMVLHRRGDDWVP